MVNLFTVAQFRMKFERKSILFIFSKKSMLKVLNIYCLQYFEIQLYRIKKLSFVVFCIVQIFISVCPNETLQDEFAQQH